MSKLRDIYYCKVRIARFKLTNACYKVWIATQNSECCFESLFFDIFHNFDFI